MKRKRIDVDTFSWRKTETRVGCGDMRSALETGEAEGVADTRCEGPKLGTYT